MIRGQFLLVLLQINTYHNICNHFLYREEKNMNIIFYEYYHVT